MTISQQRKALEHNKDTLFRAIELIEKNIKSLQLSQSDPNSILNSCYDNRHNKIYYKNFERRALTLRNKTKLSAPEQEIVINHMLSCVYYPNLYPDFLECNLKNKYSKNEFMNMLTDMYTDDHIEKVSKLLKLGLYCFKIKLAPVRAEQYLVAALKSAQQNPLLCKTAKEIYIPVIYDYLSIILDEQGRVTQAITYLTKSINLKEQYKTDRDLIKYQYIKQALLYSSMGEFTNALDNLNKALNYKNHLITGGRVFYMNGIIYWEKVKIFAQKKNYLDAKKTLTELITICQKNYVKYNKSPVASSQECILTLLKNYSTVIGAKTIA